MAHSFLPSPVGTLTLIANDVGLTAILWADERVGRIVVDAGAIDASHPILVAAGRQLAGYFAGELTSFDLPLAPVGTAFQQRVWRALADIPFGETRSYLDLASALDNPSATRAVGAANGRNPLSIVLPCHRVVGSAGALTGFAGGVAAKRWLLDHEASVGGVHNLPLFA